MAEADLIVVGAGPAGASAALAANAKGMRVVLIDEAARPGGQVYRAPPKGIAIAEAAKSSDDRSGDSLRAALAASSVDIWGSARVWSVSGRFRVDVVSTHGNASVTAPRLIAATGAFERIVPFPGWTMPGVIGLAAATILLKAEGMLPGNRTVVAGCGPLLAAVAAKIIEGGGCVAAIVDLSSPYEWLSLSPGIATRPGLMRQGLGWCLRIGRSRVPVFFRHTVIAVHGSPRVSEVAVAPVDGEGRRRPGPVKQFDADALAIGHGLVPGAEITRLLRADHVFCSDARVWTPVLDRDGRTTLPGLLAAGDGASVAGATPSMLSGRRAGLAAALDSGFISTTAFADAIRLIVDEQIRTSRFANAINRLMRPKPPLVHAIAPETIVCRCEDVIRAEIDEAIKAGASEMNQLKHFTRCGMGPCQGRMCSETAAELLAIHVGREAAGYWTARPPLRPVALASVLGTFSYDDIPVPTPAPL